VEQREKLQNSFIFSPNIPSFHHSIVPWPQAPAPCPLLAAFGH
jgi:hypothetical protein